MEKEDILKDLVNLIDKKSGYMNYQDGVDKWKKAFLSNKALNWDEDIISLESQYLKKCLSEKKVLNVYDLTNNEVMSDNKFKEKLILWDKDITNIVVDSIAVPASFDICSSDRKDLDDIYYLNGIRLRKKILNIMDGEKLDKNEVLISRSYGIFADYIIHVNYADDINKSILNLLECCRVNMIKSVIICCDFTLEVMEGIYQTIVDYLNNYEQFFDKIIMYIKDTNNMIDLISYINKGVF